MMMSPSTGGRSSRKGINEVKDSLSSTFKSIGTGSAKVGAASSGGPDAQMLELKQSLRKSGKLLRTKLGVKYLYSSDEGLAEGVLQDDQKTGLLSILSAVKQGKVEPEEAAADVSAIVAIGMQDKYVTVLGERVALWHQGVNDANMARVDDAIAAIKRLERRLTGVKQPGTGPEEDLIKHLMSQYRADMRDVFAADEVVRTTRQKETGMKVAREGQRRKGHKNSWQNADQLDDDQLEVLTGKTKLEKALDEMIKSIADEVYTDVRRRDEAALGILGQYSGLADNKNGRADLTALKKLKDSKLDKMDTDPDSRTAGLIRTQIGLLVKANIKTLWPIAAASKLLSNNNLIGKDVYIVKNNDLVQFEGEDADQWLDRMQFELGFGPTPSRKRLEEYGHGEDIDTSRDEHTGTSVSRGIDIEDRSSYWEDGTLNARGDDHLRTPGVRPSAPPSDGGGDGGTAASPAATGGSSDTVAARLGIKAAKAAKAKLAAEEAAHLFEERDRGFDPEEYRRDCIRSNIEDFVTANGVLYTLLEQELKPAVDSAVEKSGNLFGDNLQDSRINNAARGDGLAVIETWIFSLERFGDSAREAAHDFMRNGAGWLCQNNWKGGLETLRLGTLAAIDIGVEVTWAMTISRFMEKLYVHRPVVAQRMAEEYGSEPADRQRNVIHDIPVFIGRVSKLIEAMTSGERKLKEGKHQKEQRALAVARAQSFAYSVVAYDADRWDVIDAPKDVEKYVANFTTNSGGGGGGKGNGKSGGGKGGSKLPAGWKMWKPQGASYDDKGQRVCDNQSCTKCLTKERYALVVDKQKWSDTRAIDRGKSKGLAAWMHCESCDSRMSSDKKSVVYPDGYMPGVREQDRSKATPEMRERMSGGGGGFKKGGGGPRHAKANAAAAAASDSDDDAESIAFGSEASTYSQSSQAEELRAARQEALEAKLAAAESKTKALEAEASLRDVKDGGSPVKVKGRGQKYRSKLRMDGSLHPVDSDSE